MGMDYKELERALWKNKVDQFEFLQEKDREVFYRIGLHFEEDPTFLYRLNEAIIGRENYLEDEKTDLRFEREMSKYIVTYKNQDFLLKGGDLREWVASLIDIFEEILPLGSVVDLKKEYFKKISSVNKVEHMRIVITHRFLCMKECEYYFPYAGVIYPVGMLGKEEVLNFTPSLIEKIVYRGYRDEEEEAFLLQTKRELLLEKEMHSFAFAPKEHVREFNR